MLSEATEIEMNDFRFLSLEKKTWRLQIKFRRSTNRLLPPYSELTLNRDDCKYNNSPHRHRSVHLADCLSCYFRLIGNDFAKAGLRCNRSL